MATDDSSHRRLHAIVHGLVQGVNFRAFTRRKAIEEGLTGWVRNLHDGTVETIAEGAPEALEAFEEFLHIGSPSASVSHVTTEWIDAINEFTDFHIRYF